MKVIENKSTKVLPILERVKTLIELLQGEDLVLDKVAQHEHNIKLANAVSQSCMISGEKVSVKWNVFTKLRIKLNFTPVNLGLFLSRSLMKESLVLNKFYFTYV